MMEQQVIENWALCEPHKLAERLTKEELGRLLAEAKAEILTLFSEVEMLRQQLGAARRGKMAAESVLAVAWQDRQRLDSGMIEIHGKDECGETVCIHKGLNLRQMIDAAREYESRGVADAESGETDGNSICL